MKKFPLAKLGKQAILCKLEGQSHLHIRHLSLDNPTDPNDVTTFIPTDCYDRSI